MDFLDKIAYKLFYKRLKKYFPDPLASEDTMESSMKRLKKLAPEIYSVIDVGAAQGTWTEKALKFWPESAFFLLEPLQEREVDLKLLSKKFNNVQYILAAVADKEGILDLTISDDLDGSGFYGVGNLRKVPVVTLDKIVEEYKLKPPYLIKLDTHGFEYPIITGSEAALKNTSIFIVEVYGYQLTSESMVFWEICDVMDKHGFWLVDMVDVMRREIDETFWQADFVFMKKDLPSFSNKNYR